LKNAKTTYTENCMECGALLEYLNYAMELKCSNCGKVEQGYIRCSNNHYLCESCHNRQSVEQIKAFCLSTKSISPFKIAEEMIALPQLPMLGCQHAFIAVGALMAALRNERTLKVDDDQIEEAFRRTEKQAISGYCGLTGVCGIAPAIGACLAVLLNSKCGTDKEQRLTMQLVSRVCQTIADLTGPSCCKAYLRASLEVAAQFLTEYFQINPPSALGSTECQYSQHHPHGCRGSQCPYFVNTNG
jgi:predicted RNA-binding Zn-ribbon protein involved in translation (DUF1610 family)